MLDWAGFALAVLLIELTPGPNMAWLAGLSATEGRRAGLAATFGTTVGLALNAILAAAGLAALITHAPIVLTFLRWVGAAMMLGLAWAAWRSAETSAASLPTGAHHTRRYFAAGLAINLLNPKAFLFYVVVAPQFVTGGTLEFRHALIFSAISVTIATVVHLAIIFAGSRAHNWAADPARWHTVRRIMAAVMVGVALWFVLANR